MVQTVYDRPERRARVTAKGRSDKKVVVQRGGVHRVRRMIRLRGLTAGTDRANPGQSIPEHPWDAASSQTCPVRNGNRPCGLPRGATNSQPLHLAVPLGLWRTSLVLVLLLSFGPLTCRYPPFLGPRHNRPIQIQQHPQ